MVSSINTSLAAALLNATSNASTGVSADLLVAAAKARAGIGADTTTATQDPDAPLAPVWQPGISPSAAALVQRALANKSFFDTDAKLYSDLGAKGDYQRLFALYSGLSTLQALAGRAGDTTLSKADLAKNQAQFTRGLSELQGFFTEQQFEDIRLAQGDRVDSTQSTLAIPTKSEDYLTGLIHRGSLSTTVSGLDPNAQFTIVATSAGGTVRNVVIDLSQMGGQSRSLGNVISFVNTKLAAAGASSRLEAVDQTPKTAVAIVGGRTVSTRYTGPKQYALKVDVRSNETVAFSAAGANPAFYAVGTTTSGARLIKLEDTDGATAQPQTLTRPSATGDPIGGYVAIGWLGPGAPYATAPGSVGEQRTVALMSTGANNMEKALRAPGDAQLKVDLGDGRTLSLTTGWRSEDLEAWRARSGESSDRAILDDLAERFTQLLHEQGVAAGVDVWEDNGNLGFSVLGGDGVHASGLSISGKAVALTTVAQPGDVGGLRDGVFARRFEANAVAAASDLFEGKQTFTFTTATGSQTISIDGGEDGVDADTITARLNLQLHDKGIAAAAYFVDNGGALTLRFDALHDVLDVSATLNGDAVDLDLQAPGAWADGGLPSTGAGEPYGDAIHSYTATGASPLLSNTGALDIQVVVATLTGNKTISVAVSALERANDPDTSPGHWSDVFQDRLDAALNAAGVYVSGDGGELTNWSIAESAGQHLVSVSVNGNAVDLEGTAPAFGLGGALSAERSFTSVQAATGISDDVAALLSDQNVSITFATPWGDRTVSAVLQPGDPRTLESAALRLNEALAAQGYDLGVAATALSGGGAGLRVVTGASHTVRTIGAINLGGVNIAATLDPIDSISRADDPVGAARVAVRAARDASVTETIAGTSPFTAPTANSSAWFAGRAFDVAVGGSNKVATARSVATGADGSVYVLADVAGDSSTSSIKGARDVALLKYDSAGKLAFTEILGAAQSASGFALAVSADGKVAVAGAVEGDLSGTSAKGGADSFVSLFDANGKELWTQRRGATGADEASAVAFASNGSVIVSGKTASALPGQIAIGGNDGYLRGYSAAGAELFTRQFGTGGDDAATALLVRDNGVGGFDIFTGGVENNRGVVRAFGYSASAGLSSGATRDIGYFYGGAINALAADGASLYVGGAVGADRLALGSTARGAVAGKEGFVARLDAGLISTALDRASYLGSAQDDAVNALAIVNGDVYAAGNTGGLIAGAGGANVKQAFLTRLGDDGDAAWTRTFTSAGGPITLTSLAVDQSGASALDVLGLPRGTVAVNDSSPLVNRSSLRVGDEFKIGVDGKRLVTIKVGEKDTLASLATTITRAIGGAGRAEIVHEDGVDRIKITPKADVALRIEPGTSGRDALPALGFAQGVVSVNGAGRGSMKTFGLGLIAADLKLDTTAAITRTKAELSAAISIVRQAYDTLLNPNAKPLTAEEQALADRRANAGAAPAYLTSQLANYKAALSRLTGSS